jgi:hypothetical protein
VCTHGSNRALLRGPSTSPLDAVDSPRLFRLLWWIFSRAYPPLMAFGWPALALYGALEPRLSDLNALHLRKGEAAILVGTAQTQHSYIVVPRDLLRATVSQVSDIAGTVTVIEHPGVGVWILIIWGACLYGTWYFWIRRDRAGI